MKRQDIETCRKRPDRTARDSSKRSRHMGRLSLLSVLIPGIWAVAFVPAGEPAGKDPGLFYRQNCVRCHGADGAALGPDGKKLKGQDLTDEQWLQRTDDDEMVHTILKGKFFGIAMPSYEDTLSKEEARRMVTDIIRKSRKGKTIEAGITAPED